MISRAHGRHQTSVSNIEQIQNKTTATQQILCQIQKDGETFDLFQSLDSGAD
jgi:hypothetical protein